jgi:TonB family protein
MKKSENMMATSKQINKSIKKRRFSGILPGCLIACILTGILFTGCGNNPGTESAMDEASGDATSYHGDSVYTIVYSQPQFPGGEQSRVAFLRENLQYPQTALHQGIQGTVFVSFIVRFDGRITDVNILRGVSEELDLEVVRVMQLMPEWVPGKLVDDSPVSVIFNMPVRFVADEQPLSARIPRGRAGEVLVIIGEEIFIRESGQRTRFDELIGPDEIESLTILTDEEAIEAYGYETVIMITRKN